jgi:hypothetical protein
VLTIRLFMRHVFSLFLHRPWKKLVFFTSTMKNTFFYIDHEKY